MTGPWQNLFHIFEAKSETQLKDDLYRYMTRRYGEHAADEAMSMMQRLQPRDFAKQIEAQYFDSNINKIAQALVSAVDPEDKRGPGRPPKEPRQAGLSTDKGSGGSEPIPARPDRTGTQAKGIDPLVRPGSKFGQDPGTAGQNAPKPQPSQALRPSTVAQDLERLRAQRDKIKADPRRGAEVADLDQQIAKLSKSGESGQMDRQRQVDYVTVTYGTQVGNRLAKRLRVPTSGERGGELTREPSIGQAGGQGAEWKKKPTVLNPDALAKAMSNAPEERPDGSTWDPEAGGGVSSLKKGASGSPNKASDLPPPEAGGSRTGPKKPVDPFTGKMRRGDFPWQKWQPAGVSKKVMTARPDAATGNTVRGSRYTNPAQEGEPMFWNPDAPSPDGPKGEPGDWITKSQAVAARAQKKAAGG